MKRSMQSVGWLLLVGLMCSCAAAPLPPPESGYEEGGVEIAVKADDQLNLSGGRPHTLVLCIYQLATPNAFNQLSGDEDGLYRLLECSLFDASVASAKRLIVHPGDSTTHTLDRAEGAKYVAVAAGYYHALDAPATIAGNIALAKGLLAAPKKPRKLPLMPL